MLLPLDRIRQGLLHSDREVRDAVAWFFGQGYVADANAMSRVIKCVDELSWHEAFTTYRFLRTLIQTDSSLDWLMERLDLLRYARSPLVQHVREAVTDAILNASVGLLTPRLSRLAALLGRQAHAVILERIEIAACSPDELWRRLDAFCRKHCRQGHCPFDAYDRAQRLLEGLWQHPGACGDRIHKILGGQAPRYWPNEFAIILAGCIRLETALPQLLEIFDRACPWVDGDCCNALAALATDDIVKDFERRFVTAKKSLRDRIACVLLAIYTQQAVSARLRLVEHTSDPLMKQSLVHRGLQHFATEALQPARQFVIEFQRECYVGDVCRSARALCRLMNRDYEGNEGWLQLADEDEIFRRRSPQLAIVT
jgi:hypothetical protein